MSEAHDGQTGINRLAGEIPLTLCHRNIQIVLQLRVGSMFGFNSGKLICFFRGEKNISL